MPILETEAKGKNRKNSQERVCVCEVCVCESMCVTRVEYIFPKCEVEPMSKN